MSSGAVVDKVSEAFKGTQMELDPDQPLHRAGKSIEAAFGAE
jgi:hypothetical protein